MWATQMQEHWIFIDEVKSQTLPLDLDDHSDKATIAPSPPCLHNVVVVVPNKAGMARKVPCISYLNPEA